MQRAVTNGIAIEVESNYLPHRSNPMRANFYFSYQITITNAGDRTVQLTSRYWKIKDAYGNVDEVQGLGVIGEQPIISPGKSFSYTSYCPLRTAGGEMQGYYQMRYEDGTVFQATIPAFRLIIADSLN